MTINIVKNYKLRASFRITNALYYKAIIDCGYKAEKSNYSRVYRVQLNDEEDNSDRVKKEIGERYLQYVIGCSSNTLQAILDSHEEGICIRASKTLEAIKNELLERVLYEKDISKDKKIDLC